MLEVLPPETTFTKEQQADLAAATSAIDQGYLSEGSKLFVDILSHMKADIMTKAAVADAEKRFEKTRKADLDAALKLKAAQAEGDAARNGETPTAVNGASPAKPRTLAEIEAEPMSTWLNRSPEERARILVDAHRGA